MKLKNYIFSFTFLLLVGCQTKNCNDLDCLNGGYCDDGYCECPEGFFGEHCEKMLSPTSLRIKSIKIDEVLGGTAWDDYLNGPDLYLKIYKNNNPVFISKDTIQNFTNNSSTYNFPPFYVEPSYKIELPIADNYLVEVIDYDPQDPDDLIDRVGLTFNNLDGKKTKFQMYTGGYVILTVEIEYGF